MNQGLETNLTRQSNAVNYRKQKPRKKVGEILLDVLIVMLVIATGLMIGYRVTTEEAQVVGHSMDNTLANEEKIVYEKISGTIGDYSKGDILIIKETAIKSANQDSQQIVKRLIAKAGDTIDFTTDGKPIVNGNQIYEPYIKEQSTTKISDVSQIIQRTNKKYNTNFNENSKVIPEGYYFVMGDNRNNSSDSRVFGLYAKSDILGRVAYSHTYHHFY